MMTSAEAFDPFTYYGEHMISDCEVCGERHNYFVPEDIQEAVLSFDLDTDFFEYVEPDATKVAKEDLVMIFAWLREQHNIVLIRNPDGTHDTRVVGEGKSDYHIAALKDLLVPFVAN